MLSALGKSIDIGWIKNGIHFIHFANGPDIDGHHNLQVAVALMKCMNYDVRKMLKGREWEKEREL